MALNKNPPTSFFGCLAKSLCGEHFYPSIGNPSKSPTIPQFSRSVPRRRHKRCFARSHARDLRGTPVPWTQKSSVKKTGCLNMTVKQPLDPRVRVVTWKIEVLVASKLKRYNVYDCLLESLYLEVAFVSFSSSIQKNQWEFWSLLPLGKRHLGQIASPIPPSYRLAIYDFFVFFLNHLLLYVWCKTFLHT